MGRRKYLVEGIFEKSPVVSFSDLEKIVKSKKKKEYTKQLVRNLLKQGRIKKLAKGFYTKSDEAGLSVFCFKPAYLGLQSALSFHGLWEQETIPVILSAARIRPGIRQSLGTNILLKRIDKRYLFGVEYYLDSGFYLPYSDLEKTLIDFFVCRERMSKEVLKKIRERINPRKLEIYLKKYPSVIRKKVYNALKISSE